MVKFHLWAYQIGAKATLRRGQDTGRIRKLLIEEVGEPPVLTDTQMIERSAQNLSQYLFNRGFFDNEVSYKTKSILKRTTVTYQVKEGTVYRIKNIVIKTADRPIHQLVSANMEKSYLKAGKPVEYEDMGKERDRITLLLRNTGYYFFNKAYIEFKLDSSVKINEVTINILINERADGVLHRPQTISKVSLIIYNGLSVPDTLVSKGISFVRNGYKIKTPILIRSTMLAEKQLYRQLNVDNTYTRLLALGLFKFVNINFTSDTTLGSPGLNAYITVSPTLKHDFSWEPQVITSERSLGLQNNSLGRNYGIANEFVLKNKNVFRNAEEFNIRWRQSFETQFSTGSSLGPLSNISNNFSAELVIPKLLFAGKFDRNPSFQNTKTSMTFSFLLEKNPNFTRTVFPFSFGYQVTSGLFLFNFSPLNISFNKAEVSSDFREKLNVKDSLFIERLFSNYIITGPKFFLYYSTKLINPNNYWDISSNALEISGLAMSKIFKEKELFGVPFSVFIRSDVDIRYHQNLDVNNRMVYRIYSGIGSPIGKNAFLPFERRFFVGGTNSLRAWRPRTIGPGTYSDASSVQIDKSGEILLQGNTEYRFSILPGRLEGALFLDAGNIWNIKSDSLFTNSTFGFKKFYREFAFNTGLGLRYDFSFFLIRFDWGIPLHDPSYTEGDRWVIKNISDRKWVFNQTILNIAVGYPF